VVYYLSCKNSELLVILKRDWEIMVSSFWDKVLSVVNFISYHGCYSNSADVTDLSKGFSLLKNNSI
jgi:hypothetical protein